MQTYKQNLKNEAREKLVKHAIQSLTDERHSSFLVSQEHFIKITDHFNKMFFKFLETKILNISINTIGFFKRKK